MSILDRLKNKAVAARNSEAQLYSIVEQEMATGKRNEALWLMAVERSRGNTEKQLTLYIGLRIQALRDDTYQEGVFDKLKGKAVAARKFKEKLYALVAQEMADGYKHKPLWLKALKQAKGDTEEQTFQYIGLRIQALQDETHVLSQLEKEISNQLTTLGSDVNSFVAPETDLLVDMIKSGATLEELRASLQGSSANKLQEIVNNPDSAEQLPLHTALKKDRMDVAKWLLSLGANTETKNYWGRSAKEIVAQEIADGDQCEALWLKALGQTNGKINKQLSRYIILRSENPINKKFNIDFHEDKFYANNFDADTFIDKITNNAPLKDLKALLKGASLDQLQEVINKPDSGEELPLHAALKKDRMDVTEWLLALGANTESQNYWGKTAKEIAESKHSDEALKLVLLYGPRS